MSKKIVLASNNKGKVREIGQLLAGFNMEVLPQSEFNIEEVDETGLTFVENAILKARNAAEHSGLPAIADDSGLEVDALKVHPVSTRHALPVSVPVMNKICKSYWLICKTYLKLNAPLAFNA